MSGLSCSGMQMTESLICLRLSYGGLLSVRS